MKLTFFPSLFLLMGWQLAFIAVVQAQSFETLCKQCEVDGTIVLYDFKGDKWFFSDSAKAMQSTLPASTFKIINSLIALETGVIKDENEVVRWPGKTDTILYGYRPEIYHDMTVREAFEVSAGWVYIELAKRIGKERYRSYLQKAGYGNGNLSHPDDDFWNYGVFGISPKNQVEFLIRLYKNELPFSKRSMDLVKKIMISEKTTKYLIHAKTGWTRQAGINTGWWVGWMETKKGIYFFATRLLQPRTNNRADFGSCRKTITMAMLKQFSAL